MASMAAVATVTTPLGSTATAVVVSELAEVVTPPPSDQGQGGRPIVPTSVDGLDFNMLGYIDLAPLVSAVHAGVNRELPDLGGYMSMLIDSKPFWELVFAAIRHLPFTLAADQLGINTWYYAMSSRVNYIETWGRSFISFVHNFVMAVLCSLAAAFTFGRISDLNFITKKYWIQTAIAASVFGISTVGIASPTKAASVTSSLVLWIANVAKSGSENQAEVSAAVDRLEGRLIEGIKATYVRNKDMIHEIARRMGMYQTLTRAERAFHTIESLCHMAAWFENLLGRNRPGSSGRGAAPPVEVVVVLPPLVAPPSGRPKENV